MKSSDDSKATGKKLANSAPFEDIVARIETIAGALEGGEARLEEALALFEEGMQLCQRGTARLDEAERKVEVLLEDNRVTRMVRESPSEGG